MHQTNPNLQRAAAGFRHSLALKSDGTVLSWGAIGWEASTPAASPIPVTVPGLPAIAAVAAGSLHNLALGVDGSIWAWGRNEFGQLGRSFLSASSLPLRLSLSGADSISAGRFHSVAVRSNGLMMAWGDNRYGQLGESERSYLTNLTLVQALVLVTNYSFATNVTSQEVVRNRLETVFVTNVYEVVNWVEKHYVSVVDYADATEPVIRSPINIPGHLRGISHAGAILYSVHHEETNELIKTWIQASAFDEVSVSLVDQLQIPDPGADLVIHPLGSLFITRPATATHSDTIESWSLSETTARFTRNHHANLPGLPQNLVSYGEILAARAADGIHFFEALDLSPMGVADLPACLFVDFDRAALSGREELWLPLGEYGVRKLSIPAAPLPP